MVEALAPLLSLPIVPEIARILCEEAGFENITDVPDQQAFKEHVLARQIETEEQLQSFVCDRSTIDCWVLWQRWSICQAMTYDTERYYERARKQAGLYTHIIYVPKMFEPVDDGFRWIEPDYLKQIDRLIRMTLYDWNLWERTHVVQTLSNDERVREVINWIQSNGN